MTTNHHTRPAGQPKTLRHMKVKSAYHSYQLKQEVYNRTPIGEIQLKGHWLIQAGFDIDSNVTIRIMDGCLVLTNQTQQSPD